MDYTENRLNVWWGLFFTFISIICSPQTLYAINNSTPKQIIVSASEDDYPPFCLTNSDNQADGFSVELLRAALKAMGKEVSFEIGPWVDVKQKLIDRQVQVLPLVGRTPEREAQFDFTFPYISMRGSIIVRDDSRDIRSLKDLVGKRIAVMKGDNAEEFLRRENFSSEITTTENFDIALLELADGKYDAVIIQKLLAMQLINKLQIKNLQPTGPPLEKFVQSFCFAVAEGDSKLLGILNEGLSVVIADGTFGELRKKWFSTLDVLKKSRIIVGGDYNYPPYEYLDENGQPAGYNVDLTRAIAKQLGISVDIQLGPWGEIRRKLENGEIDLVQGMFYSAERDKIFDFTDAHTLISHVVSARQETPFVTSLEELAGKTTVVMKGDIMHDLAVKVGLKSQLLLAETQQEALSLVASGDAEYALAARIPALFWINKEQISGLKVGSKSFISAELCYASKHANTDILNKFSHALLNLKADGSYRKIHQKWLGIYEEKLAQKEIIKYSFYVAAPLLFLLIIAIFWGRSLRAQVAARTEDCSQEVVRCQKSEERFRTLIKTIPDLIWLKDSDGVYLACNEMFERFFGAKETDIVGKTDYDFVDKKLADFFRKNDQIAMEADTPSHNEEWVTFADDGQKRLLDTTKAPVYGSAKELIGVLGVARDITKRKEAEGQRLALEDQLRHKSKTEAIGLLAGGMAHNFNNNLSIILGSLELLNLEGDDNLEFLNSAKTGVMRSRELIQQIMDYSRTGVKGEELFDISEIVEESLGLLKATIPSTVDIQSHLLTEDQPVIILASPTRVQEALLNLCHNAVHAMEGKGTLAILLGRASLTEKDIPFQFEECAPGDFVRLSVKDTGAGINSDVLDKIFDPFFTTKEMNSGTGMGLATVQGVVSEAGGLIKVHSEPGKGASFDLFFPVSDLSPDKEPKNDKGINRSGEVRILLVDDDKMIATLVQRMLTEQGYHVESMIDGIEALELLRKNSAHFDLLITDQSMPGLTGVELISESLKIKPDLLAIICTGDDSELDREEASNVGVKSILMKPFSESELLEAIKHALKEVTVEDSSNDVAPLLD